MNNLDTSQIEHYESQKCIGYNADFTRSYFESVVILKRGGRKTLYSYTERHANGLESTSDEYTDRPTVAHKA